MTLTHEAIDRAVLGDLIERVEKAAEGDGDLDREIAMALGWTPPAIGLAHWHDPDGNHWTALDDWSTSIDAALALCERMLPGYAADVTRFNNGSGMCVLWRGLQSHKIENDDICASPALAIILALLRSLHSAGGQP